MINFNSGFSLLNHQKRKKAWQLCTPLCIASMAPMGRLPVPMLHSSPHPPTRVPDKLVLPKQSMASGGSWKLATCKKCQILLPVCWALLSKPLVEWHHPATSAGTTHEGKSITKETVNDMEELKEPAITWSTFSPHIIKDDFKRNILHRHHVCGGVCFTQGSVKSWVNKPVQFLFKQELYCSERELITLNKMTELKV